ncbi:MAG: DUF4276 family protein [Chloroflexi bacterium]|nr:DUF4276 family protein [Chloroflexota bacterium]
MGELKRRLEIASQAAKLTTKSAVLPGLPFQVLNRIAIEELEAWFFGDVSALRSAYSRIPESLGRRAAFRNPDAIEGGAWEKLKKVLQQAGYYPSGISKVEVSQKVSQYMEPDLNLSNSFRVFRDGLRALVNT